MAKDELECLHADSMESKQLPNLFHQGQDASISSKYSTDAQRETAVKTIAAAVCVNGGQNITAICRTYAGIHQAPHHRKTDSPL